METRVLYVGLGIVVYRRSSLVSEKIDNRRFRGGRTVRDLSADVVYRPWIYALFIY